MKKPNDIEQEAHAIIDAVFNDNTDVAVILKPAQLCATIALIQLAQRHPGLSAHMNHIANQLARYYEAALLENTDYPELASFITKGFNPAFDAIELNGQEISRQPKINLVTLLQQAADQISHPTLKGILYSFINLSRKHEPVNIEIDLATLLHTDSPADLDSKNK